MHYYIDNRGVWFETEDRVKQARFKCGPVAAGFTLGHFRKADQPVQLPAHQYTVHISPLAIEIVTGVKKEYIGDHHSEPMCFYDCDEVVFIWKE